MTQLSDYTQDILITEDFIRARDALSRAVPSYGRPLNKVLQHCDATIVEHTLINKGVVSAPIHFGHDYIDSDGYFVDVKVVSGKYFNVENNKDQWYIHCINLNMLDYFSFWRKTKGPNRPFVVGDIVSYEHIKTLDVKFVLSNLTRSMYNKRNKFFTLT